MSMLSFTPAYDLPIPSQRAPLAVKDLWSDGAVGLIGEYEKKTAIERKRRRPLISLISMP